MYGKLLEDSLGCCSAAAKGFFFFFFFFFFFLPEEIHIPYICLNEFCKLAICSVPVTHAALEQSCADFTSALTWNTVFIWLLLRYTATLPHRHTHTHTHAHIHTQSLPIYRCHFTYNWSFLTHVYIEGTPLLQM